MQGQGYGLVIGNSTKKDVQPNSAPGFKAYAWLSTHQKTRNKIIGIIKSQNADVSDTTVESIIQYLEEDLLNHDYDVDRAWNEQYYAEMSIEGYILSRVRYAVLAYNARQMKQNKVTVKNGGKTTDLYVRTVSLDGTLGHSTGESSNTTLQDVVPHDIQLQQLETILEDNDVDNLVERITGFSERTDTNINVIIYATTCLNQWCEHNYNESAALQLVLKTLGFTNYASIRELQHNEEFIEITRSAANVSDKVRLIQQLAKNMFCIKEITAAVQYIAAEVNTGRFS